MAAQISGTERENASASSGSAPRVSSRFPTTSGRRGLTRSTNSPAATAPTPNEAEISPQAVAPPSDRAAMTGPSTSIAGIAKFQHACAIRLIQYHGRIASSCQPSARSARNDPAGGSDRGGSRSIARQITLTTNVAASKANSQPVPKTAMSTPPTAGPPTLNRLCGRSRRLLACCSWSAGTVSGVSPVEAGPKNDAPIPYSTAPTAISHTRAWPVSSSTASTASTPPRSTSAASITNCRRSRSAHTPPASRNTTRATVCSAAMSPMSVAVPPMCSTAKTSAICTTASPSAEVVEPSHISRYDRIASGARASAKRERGLRPSS